MEVIKIDNIFLFDNMNNSEMYIEFFSEINITINSSTNENGKILIDDLNNDLIGIFDIGITKLKKLETYTESRKLLLYDTRTWGLYSQEDVIQNYIDFDNGTNYKIDADIEYYSTFDGISQFTFTSLTDKDIFKVFLNGIEVVDYSKSGDNIIIQGDFLDYIDIIDNDMFIITYSSIQTISFDIIITYDGFNQIFDPIRFLDDCILDKTNLTKIGFYKSFDITNSRENTKFKNNFEIAPTTFTNDIRNSLNIEHLQDSLFNDIQILVGNNKFRLIQHNPHIGKAIFYNNCSINDGDTSRIAKENNTRRFTVDFGNYIIAGFESELSYYGEGIYGFGTYGAYGGYLIFNSRRVIS